MMNFILYLLIYGSVILYSWHVNISHSLRECKCLILGIATWFYYTFSITPSESPASALFKIELSPICFVLVIPHTTFKRKTLINWYFAEDNFRDEWVSHPPIDFRIAFQQEHPLKIQTAWAQRWAEPQQHQVAVAGMDTVIDNLS